MCISQSQTQINKRLPRCRRPLHRPYIAAIINREDGRKIRGPTDKGAPPPQDRPLLAALIISNEYDTEFDA